MESLPALPVAVPLLGGALLAAVATFLNRRVIDAYAILLSAAVLGICLVLLTQVVHEPLVYWFGGWRPSKGIVLGVSFVIDPIGAGLAVLAAGLVVAALVYSWRYFDAVGGLYHVLLLMMLAGMIGISLSGDLFNMFVFLELMSVAAFALTGYKVEEFGPLQGALNFAITNSVGAFLILWGIALLYGRTGSLNLAEIGETLAGGSADGLVIATFVLLTAGFLIKAAVVPFHFWLADAYASAPIPVCVLFAGVMSELGLYAFARIHTTIFSAVLDPAAHSLETLLVSLGAMTAVVGAIMSVRQHNVERLLAFSVIAHAGLYLIGIAVFEPAGLAGVAIFVVSDGLIRAALFMCVGVVQHRVGTLDELEVAGRARRLPVTGATFLVATLAFAGLPPFATYLGKALVEEEAAVAGFGWTKLVFVAVSMLTAGGLLRFFARAWIGFGGTRAGARGSPAGGTGAEPETTRGRSKTPWVMVGPAIALCAFALALGLWPGVAESTEAAAESFLDSRSYSEMVLVGSLEPIPKPAEQSGPKRSELVYAFAAIVGATLVAAFALYRARFSEGARARTWRLVGPAADGLRLLHSGKVGDYLAWTTLGVALLGGAMALFVS